VSYYENATIQDHTRTLEGAKINGAAIQF